MNHYSCFGVCVLKEYTKHIFLSKDVVSQLCSGHSPVIRNIRCQNRVSVLIVITSF